jgi:hypothetical protein
MPVKLHISREPRRRLDDVSTAPILESRYLTALSRLAYPYLHLGAIEVADLVGSHDPLRSITTSINYDLRFASLYDLVFLRLSNDPVSKRVPMKSHRVLNRTWDQIDHV